MTKLQVFQVGWEPRKSKECLYTLGRMLYLEKSVGTYTMPYCGVSTEQERESYFQVGRCGEQYLTLLHLFLLQLPLSVKMI